LALGIGANTAIFRVLDAVVLRQLPVQDPSKLVIVDAFRGDTKTGFSYPLFHEMAASQQVLAGMAAMVDLPVETFEDAGRTVEGVTARLVSGGYFPTLGVLPGTGRLLDGGDDEPSSAGAAVISDSFWRRAFDSRPDILGRVVRINHAAVSIVGVAPRGFFGDLVGSAPDVWLPLAKASDVNAGMLIGKGAKLISVMGRLRADVPTARAASILGGLYGQLHELASQALQGPDTWRVDLTPGDRGLNGLNTHFSEPLWVLMAIVALVLLIACCNLANLLMARATARTHEIGVRIALGAGRRRLLRQLLTESAVLAAIGTTLGMLLAVWGTRQLIAIAAAGAQWRIAVDFGLRVLLFTSLVSAAAVCLFGLAPAFAATRVDVHSALQGGRSTSGVGKRKAAFSRMLVVAQIAFSLLLVAASSLLLRSFWNLLHQDLGYQPEGVLLANIPLSPQSLALSKNRGRTQILYDRLRTLPRVRSVAFDALGPLGDWQDTGHIAAVGESAPSEQSRGAHVSADYFHTLNIPIVAGRGFTADDARGSPPVVVLSQTAARKLFGQTNPIGRLIAETQVVAGRTMEVVGVAGDARSLNPRDPFPFLIYYPRDQNLITSIEIRTAGGARPLVGPVREIIREVVGTRNGDVRTLSDAVRSKIGQDRLLAILSVSFAVLALLLASVGLYGIVSYTIERRTRELGIRVALGATRAQISGRLMREVGLLLAAGLVVGGAVALLIGRWIGSLLFGLAPHDPIMLGSAAAILSAVALTAGYVPARRASRMDPLEALRQ
jgi:predicted permease